MNRIILIAVLIGALTSIAGAQPRGGQGQGPGHNPTERLTEELGLTVDQAAQVEVIFDQAREEHEATQLTQQEDHCVIKAVVDAQLMQVFTAEQQVLFEELAQQRPPRRRDSQGSSDEDQGPPPDRC